MKKQKVYSGFDSAWSNKNSGACASIIDENGVYRLEGPIGVSFNDALTRLQQFNEPGTYHLLAIDQPLIVPNMSSKRPVERAVSHLVGLCGGGVQPSNRQKSDMFGDDAPIWKFLKTFGGEIDPIRAVGCEEGVFVIEVFPAIGNLGLFGKYFKKRKMPKYNPDRRKTFNIEDWKDLCLETAALFSKYDIPAGCNWCEKASALTNPRKGDQDNLDAIICAIHALHWGQNGLSASLIVGDLESGYMVIPSGKDMAQSLILDAKNDGVPIRTKIGIA